MVLELESVRYRKKVMESSSTGKESCQGQVCGRQIPVWKHRALGEVGKVKPGSHSKAMEYFPRETSRVYNSLREISVLQSIELENKSHLINLLISNMELQNLKFA